MPKKKVEKVLTPEERFERQAQAGHDRQAASFEQIQARHVERSQSPAFGLGEVAGHAVTAKLAELAADAE